MPFRLDWRLRTNRIVEQICPKGDKSPPPRTEVLNRVSFVPEAFVIPSDRCPSCCRLHENPPAISRAVVVIDKHCRPVIDTDSACLIVAGSVATDF